MAVFAFASVELELSPCYADILVGKLRLTFTYSKNTRFALSCLSLFTVCTSTVFDSRHIATISCGVKRQRPSPRQLQVLRKWSLKHRRSGSFCINHTSAVNIVTSRSKWLVGVYFCLAIGTLVVDVLQTAHEERD